MAEGLLRDLAGERFDVESAGVAPTDVRPEAIEAMREVGIDISSHRSKSVDEFLEQGFDFVITVCDNAKQSCPVFPGDATRIHWSFDDPAAAGGPFDQRLDAFRTARDKIRSRLVEFIKDFSRLDDMA